MGIENESIQEGNKVKPKVEIPPRPKSRKGLFQYSAPQVDKKYMVPLQTPSVIGSFETSSNEPKSNPPLKSVKTPNFKHADTFSLPVTISDQAPVSIANSNPAPAAT